MRPSGVRVIGAPRPLTVALHLGDHATVSVTLAGCAGSASNRRCSGSASRSAPDIGTSALSNEDGGGAPGGGTTASTAIGSSCQTAAKRPEPVNRVRWGTDVVTTWVTPRRASWLAAASGAPFDTASTPPSATAVLVASRL